MPSLTSGDATNDWSGRELELVITSVLTDTLLPGLLFGALGEAKGVVPRPGGNIFGCERAGSVQGMCGPGLCSGLVKGAREVCLLATIFPPRAWGTAQGAAEARRGSQRRAIMSARGFLAMFTL